MHRDAAASRDELHQGVQQRHASSHLAEREGRTLAGKVRTALLRPGPRHRLSVFNPDRSATQPPADCGGHGGREHTVPRLRTGGVTECTRVPSQRCGRVQAALERATYFRRDREAPLLRSGPGDVPGPRDLGGRAVLSQRSLHLLLLIDCPNSNLLTSPAERTRHGGRGGSQPRPRPILSQPRPAALPCSEHFPARWREDSVRHRVPRSPAHAGRSHCPQTPTRTRSASTSRSQSRALCTDSFRAAPLGR